MRIYTKAGDLAFKTFSFPDSQPHIKLETYEREFDAVTIETAIKSANDLLMVLLAADVLRSQGYSKINLDIRYLLGARMDRALSLGEPYTLTTVARLLNGAGFSTTRLLDVHSEASTRLVRGSVNVLPKSVVDQVIATTLWGQPAVIVTPDKGARERVDFLTSSWDAARVSCNKYRDPSTGDLLKFELDQTKPVKDAHCLIVDDICDGGGTFVGLAKELRKAGAKKVFLYVTHGIFSKGLPLEGIDHVYTTDSYESINVLRALRGKITSKLTIIPVSMKKMK